MNYDPTDPDKMRLPTGKTCAQCVNIGRCSTLVGAESTDNVCDFSPSRFIQAQYSDIVSDGGMDPRNAAPHTVHDQGELTFAESQYEPNRFTIGLNGKWFMSIQHNGEQLVERQRENMRRLVACWNACQGTSTESLEQNGVVDFQTVVEANKVTAATTEALKAQLRALEAKSA